LKSLCYDARSEKHQIKSLYVAYTDLHPESGPVF